MTYDEMLKAVGSFGFPIVITLYLLWERRTAYKDLTKAIYKLKDVIEIALLRRTIRSDDEKRVP